MIESLNWYKLTLVVSDRQLWLNGALRISYLIGNFFKLITSTK